MKLNHKRGDQGRTRRGGENRIEKGICGQRKTQREEDTEEEARARCRSPGTDDGTPAVSGQMSVGGDGQC